MSTNIPSICLVKKKSNFNFSVQKHHHGNHRMFLMAISHDIYGTYHCFKSRVVVKARNIWWTLNIYQRRWVLNNIPKFANMLFKYIISFHCGLRRRSAAEGVCKTRWYSFPRQDWIFDEDDSLFVMGGIYLLSGWMIFEMFHRILRA